MPESPRWLLSKKRVPEAMKIFHRIAKSNKKHFDELEEMTDYKSLLTANGGDEKESLLNNRRMSQHSLIMHRKSISLSSGPVKKMDKVNHS